MAINNEKSPLTRNASGQRCANRETGASTDTPSVVIGTTAKYFNHRQKDTGELPDLLPCPFCGGEPKRMTLNDEANFGGDVITCTKCDCSTHVEFGEKSGLVDAWNRRFAASPAARPASLTAKAALAAIETFEIVGENNDSRDPDAQDRYILTEFIAHAFGGYPVEQHGAAPADARVHWKTGAPPTKDGEHHEYIVAVRRAHDKRRVFVFAASHANNYADDLRDQNGNEFIADGWYDIGEDPSGEFNTLFTPTLGPDDEVLGWQELPKWSAATAARAGDAS